MKKNLKKTHKKVCLKGEKGRMFAAAKTGNDLVFGGVHFGDAIMANLFRGIFFQKREKKFCGKGKRVLYLHPLNEETSLVRIRTSS